MGTINESTKFDSSDYRNTVPALRSTSEGKRGARRAVRRVAASKMRHLHTSALGWPLAQTAWVVPIPAQRSCIAWRRTSPLTNIGLDGTADGRRRDGAGLFAEETRRLLASFA